MSENTSITENLLNVDPEILNDQDREQEMKILHDQIAQTTGAIENMVRKMVKPMENILNFNANHAEALQVIGDIELGKAFISNITIDEFASYFESESTEELRQQFDSTPKEDLLMDLWENLSIGEAVKFIEHFKSKIPEKKNRTKGRAGDRVVERLPEALATITLKEYQNAMSLYEDGHAYLSALHSTDGLKFKDGKMYFATNALAPISEAQLQNMKTKENINEIDLPLLRTYYSIILNECQITQKVPEIVTCFVPDLSQFFGTGRNPSQDKIDSMIEKTQKFHNIVGLIKTAYGDSIFPVLNFEGYDKEKNTISFSSPYMTYLIEKVLSERSPARMKINPKTNKPLLEKKTQKPQIKPAYSYVIKSEIVKERNKYAVENVVIIVTTIEQAGGTGAHISANTIIERNAQLRQALETSSKPNQLLKRCFTKTFELLRTKTKLEELYPGIELPDPNNPINIPTKKTLYTTVYEIKHKGKKKK